MSTSRKIIIGAVVIGLIALYVISRMLGGTSDTTGGSATTDTTTTTAATEPQGRYKNGTYVGPASESIYGIVQVSAVITNGNLSDIKILKSPNDKDNSIEINAAAMPKLVREAIRIQSADVNLLTGATESSVSFKESLSGALAKAQ